MTRRGGRRPRDYDVEGSASEYDAPRAARAVSRARSRCSFFDPDRELHGTARSGVTLLFHGRKPTALPEGPR